MGQQVVLHVGSMKAGTGCIQSTLFANKARLAEHGVVVPGGSWRDQFDAVAQVLQRTQLSRTPDPDAWRRLVAEATLAGRSAVVSAELLGAAGPGRISTVVDAFAGAEVRVVVTARDLGRTIPAMWLEAVRNGDARTFADFVEDVRTHEGRGKNFWRQQGLASMCQRWADQVGTRNVTLMTVPGPGAAPLEVWRRFALAAGIEDLDVVPPEPRESSLGAASAEVVRRLNAELADLDFRRYVPLVRHRLSREVYGPRRSVEPVVGFQVPPWLPPLSARMQSKIEALGVRVVGSLDDLEPVSVPGIDPAGVSPEEALDASVAGMAALVRHAAASRKMG